MITSPDADAFMRKYLEQPTDVTARLVFADWLQETGAPHNAAWAYYIRLKAETNLYPHDSREFRELERQAAAYVPSIRANLTIPAQLFLGYPKSLLQLLPAANITVRLNDFEVPRPVLEYMPESVARGNHLLPLDMQGRTMLVAAADPRDADLAQKLEFILNRGVVLVGAATDEIAAALDRVYDQYPTEFVESVLYLNPGEEVGAPTDFDTQFDAVQDDQVVRLVNLTMQEAINLRADRILIMPETDGVPVRYRIDGEWIERDYMPLRLLVPVSARLAILAAIPAEWTTRTPPSLTPMTGVFPLAVPGRQFHARVTLQPSPDGPTTQIDLIANSPAEF